MIFRAMVFATCLIATSAHAEATVASKLGDILASEELCGLAYKPRAIESFVKANVAAEDMGFNGTLATIVSSRKRALAQISPSQKTAHCTQTARAAKHYGFTD